MLNSLLYAVVPDIATPILGVFLAFPISRGYFRHSNAVYAFFVGYIKGIPKELDEAAAIDGCGYLRFIFLIIMPQMKPALATFGIFGFIASWNNLILPLVMLSDSGLWPVTRGLYSFFGEHTQNWPLISAGTIIVAGPVTILFFALQRYLVEGVAGGALSGSQAVGATQAPAAPLE